MAKEITTPQALRKLKRVVENSPGVEQDLTKWYDVELKELEPGQWRMKINDDDIIYFSYYELSINEVYAARGYTEKHPKGTEFKAEIFIIDTPKGMAQGPGPFATMTREEVRQQVRDAVEKAGIPKRTPTPEPSLWDKTKKLVRMIRLRLRL